jgi:hypothetical protein
MKKSNPIFLAILALSLLSSCEKKNEYPESPTDGQTYIDNRGNTSTWNSAMGYWMIYSMMNGQRTTVCYYPSSGEYRSPSGAVVSRPSSIPRTSKFTRSGANGAKSSTGAKSSKGFGTSGHSSSSAS